MKKEVKKKETKKLTSKNREQVVSVVGEQVSSSNIEIAENLQEVKAESKKISGRSRVWHIVKVITKYNALLKLNPSKLKLMLEELGPTYVKLGQLMSMRADILPLEYCKALEGLRMSVKPMPFDLVRVIIEREFGKSLNDIFLNFDEIPIGSASIAQAHKATLLNGEKVVVKVQREHIYEIMQKDIKLLKKASKLMKLSAKLGSFIDYAGLLDEMWRVAKEEMDFIHEAQNMKKLRENNLEIKYVKVPFVYEDLVTDKVLVMEYIDGCSIDDIDRLKEQEYDLGEIAYKLCENYVKQVVDDGFYHADPHPGNIKVADGKIVWIDMGMMGELSERDRMLFRTAIRAVINNDSATLKDVCLAIGNVYGEIDHMKLNQDISTFLSKYAEMDLKTMQIGDIFNDFVAIANENNVAIPKSLTMFGRGLVSIEGVIEKLDSNMNLMVVMKNYFKGQLFDKKDLESVKANAERKAYLAVKKAVEIPLLVNDYFKQWSRGESKLNVEVTVNKRSMSGLSKFVNKIGMCVIMSFLILGGAMCTLAPNLLYFWGLPVVSWVMFLGAFCLGFYMVFPVIKRFFQRFK